MFWLMLIMGVVLWAAAHLFKRVLPRQRAALGKAGKAGVAVALVIALVLMVAGYRGIDAEPLYALPFEAWQVNNLLMVVALVLADVGRVPGVIRTKLRHPMLTGVAVWAVAHLLVNGDAPSLVLFGGLGIWALVEMAVISRAEGPWQRPERGSWARDARVLAVALVLYAIIVMIHAWLGRTVFVLF